MVQAPIAERSGAIAETVRRLAGEGIGVEDIAIRRPTLDDVFITLTGHGAEAESAGGDEAEPTDPEAER